MKTSETGRKTQEARRILKMCETLGGVQTSGGGWLVKKIGVGNNNG